MEKNSISGTERISIVTKMLIEPNGKLGVIEESCIPLTVHWHTIFTVLMFYNLWCPHESYAGHNTIPTPSHPPTPPLHPTPTPDVACPILSSQINIYRDRTWVSKTRNCSIQTRATPPVSAWMIHSSSRPHSSSPMSKHYWRTTGAWSSSPWRVRVSWTSQS